MSSSVLAQFCHKNLYPLVYYTNKRKAGNKNDIYFRNRNIVSAI